ncbi:MAG: hypothetical protein CVV50_00425 [Spirochaetae bacterium HGW-Spirochaetae-6]|nr:MAG: hypothetical protein CVV50_00425 [Spirochaetae bacterium HGW-Spirochaetae-6]
MILGMNKVDIYQELNKLGRILYIIVQRNIFHFDLKFFIYLLYYMSIKINRKDWKFAGHSSLG